MPQTLKSLQLRSECEAPLRICLAVGYGTIFLIMIRLPLPTIEGSEFPLCQNPNFPELRFRLAISDYHDRNAEARLRIETAALSRWDKHRYNRQEPWLIITFNSVRGFWKETCCTSGGFLLENLSERENNDV